MDTQRRWGIAPFVLAALALAALACDSGQSVPVATATPTLEPGGVYLALGDSIAAGQGASAAANTGYVALVAEALRSRFGPTLELQSLAVGGHTTQDLIDEQLAQAVARLQEGDVRVVTITIGGNDLYQYSSEAICIRDPANPACPLEDGLLAVEQRLDRILGELRAAGPEAIIIIQAFPNLFSGTGDRQLGGVMVFEQAAQTAFDLLDGVIIGVARRNDILVADPRAAFDGRGGELGHLLDPEPDAHPNDAGYRVIAAAFLETLGLSIEDEETN